MDFLKIHLDSDAPLGLGLCIGGGWVGVAGGGGVRVGDHLPLVWISLRSTESQEIIFG